MTKYQSSSWSLADLYPASDSPEIQAALLELEQRAADFEGVRAELEQDISEDAFLKILQQIEILDVLARRLFSFAGLAFSANTQNQGCQTFMAGIQQRLAELKNRTLFFNLWWKDLPEETARRLIPDKGDYRYWLEVIRHHQPYMLTEAEERIINLKNLTGATALNDLYETITNRYTFKLTVNEEEKELTRGEIMAYVRQYDPALRSAAYQELFKVFQRDGNILGQMYQSVVRDWYNEQISLRRFSTPISARNLDNDLPDDVVDTLLDICRKNAGLFQRFFCLKARWLGMERLRRYDIYAPVAKSERKFEFDAAVELVMDAFRDFDVRLETLARQVFDARHLDSEVRHGKRSGAFCWSVTPDLPPWVLLNYQGDADDVATMAHELGHAIHSLLAGKHSVLTFESTLPLAETASTFGEMLLIDRMLADEADENVRRDMLFRQMDDAYSTIMRQAFFALFERQAHELVQQGASVADLVQAYQENLSEQFGEALEISDEFHWEWVAIPHIYQVPFYVYAYAFGQLLVYSLYKQYKEEGDEFKPRYLKILAAGGAASPETTLKEAGIDIHNPAFWQGGFDVIAAQLDRLEQIPVVR